MPVDMAALAADLAAESAVTRALVAGLDEGVGSGWRTPTPAVGWDIADQISHLAYFDEVAVQSAVRPDEFRADLAAAPDQRRPRRDRRPLPRPHRRPDSWPGSTPPAPNCSKPSRPSIRNNGCPGSGPP